ncbi:hypothetical protein R6Z07F_008435 [Ovis aries]
MNLVKCSEKQKSTMQIPALQVLKSPFLQGRHSPGEAADCQSCVFHDLLEFAVLQASSPGAEGHAQLLPGPEGRPPGPLAAPRTAARSRRDAYGRGGPALASLGRRPVPIGIAGWRAATEPGQSRRGWSEAGGAAAAPSLTKTHR